jgi:hypothetical protein
MEVSMTGRCPKKKLNGQLMLSDTVGLRAVAEEERTRQEESMSHGRDDGLLIVTSL